MMNTMKFVFNSRLASILKSLWGPTLAQWNHSACRQAQCCIVTMCLSKFRAFAFKNITVSNPTWYETWRHEKWQMTWHHYEKFNMICFKKLLVYIIARFFLTHRKCNSQHVVCRGFLFTRGQLTEKKPQNSPWPWHKRIQPPSHVMTIVAQHRPSILNFQIESDWCCQAVEGQNYKHCLFQLKKTEEMFFNCWKVSLLETMLSD